MSASVKPNAFVFLFARVSRHTVFQEKGHPVELKFIQDVVPVPPVLPL